MACDAGIFGKRESLPLQWVVTFYLFFQRGGVGTQTNETSVSWFLEILLFLFIFFFLSHRDYKDRHWNAFAVFGIVWTKNQRWECWFAMKTSRWIALNISTMFTRLPNQLFNRIILFDSFYIFVSVCICGGGGCIAFSAFSGRKGFINSVRFCVCVCFFLMNIKCGCSG